MRVQQIQPKHYRILIVDDAEANILLLMHLLQEVGYQVYAARSGAEALQQIGEVKPDLILLDIIMPEMSGYEVMEEFKKLESFNSNTPVIFLSALTEPENKVDAFKAGAVDYINKPFNKDEVLERIKTHLTIRTLEIEGKERISILRKREEELNNLNKSKDALIRMFSHDIKNPLTGINGLISFLKNNDEISEQERDEILEVILDSSAKLLDLVKEVLDAQADGTFSKELNLSRTDLGKLAQRVVVLNKAQALQKDIELSYSNNSTITCQLDTHKIETVLNNLVSNALKFTLSKGEVSITIEEANSNKALIKISDTGIGIPKFMMDDFFQIDKIHTTMGTNGEKGTGLGIGIVKNNVEQHGGEIWVESEEGVGTTFFIELPTDL